LKLTRFSSQFLFFNRLDVHFVRRQMQKILDDTSEPAKGEMHVAALTAGQRKDWALARHNFFSKGINRTALDVIEKAAFVVCLDDIEYNFDPVSFLIP
jgi:carnitine O-palmitoyltransferase 1, liver isoform